jgi:hypothetical protein
VTTKPAAAAATEEGSEATEEGSEATKTKLAVVDTAPDFLLQPPPSVGPVVDDFFKGFIRRVEDDR